MSSLESSSDFEVGNIISTLPYTQNSTSKLDRIVERLSAKTKKNQKLTTDITNLEKRLDAHFVSFLFHYYCTEFSFLISSMLANKIKVDNTFVFPNSFHCNVKSMQISLITLSKSWRLGFRFSDYANDKGSHNWQYNMCCPNVYPAQIFISVLWKSQYIRLSYGLCVNVIQIYIVSTYMFRGGGDTL